MRFLSLVSAVLAFALAGAGCDDSGGLKAAGFPDIRSDPESVTLSALPVGESLTRVVSLRNVGPDGSKLIITHLGLSNALDESEFTLTDVTLPVTLRGRDTLTLELTYAPKDAISDAGAILVRSNDPDQPALEIPVRASEAAAELDVQPAELNFGPVPGGQVSARTVTVSNAGSVAVAVTGIALADDSSPDFAITGGGELRPELTHDVHLAVEVTYTPTGRDDDRGLLVITTADEAYPEIRVPLLGTEPSPDIEVSRPNVSFGAVDLGADSDTIDVLVQNQGSAPLSLDRLEFVLAEEGVNEQFRLHGVPESFPQVLDEGQILTFGLSYHPRVPGHHRTFVEIGSNDPDEAVVRIPVEGRVRVPCISVTPESVDFGVVAQGVASLHQPLLVTNCGDLPLNLTALRLEGGPGFGWGFPEGEPEQTTLSPLTSVTLETWFDNSARVLPEGDSADAVFVIENDTPDRPVVNVPLHVRGGGSPTCSLLLLGDPVNFGFVSRGTGRSRNIDLFNAGTGNCEVRSEATTFIGLGANPFIITARPPRLLGPGARVPVTVEFHPLTWGPMSGLLTVTYLDPYLQEEKTAQVHLQGVGGDSDIEVIPGHLEFGEVTAGDCASRTERVTVYNTGLVDLCISNIELVGAGCAEFVVVDRPVANADGCIVVSRNTPADVHLVYEPGNLGPDECALVFTSDASDNPELRVPLTGTGTAETEQTDEFLQGSGQQVDVLFMIDNSGSMEEEQDNLARNISDFIRGADQFQNDFQLGVVNSEGEGDEAGWLISEPRIIGRNAQTEAQFQASADVGTDSAQDEHGLQAVHKALTDPNIFDAGTPCQNDGACNAPDRCLDGFCGGQNRGFLRETAALEIVFLSDEEDQSPGTLNFYIDFLKSIKGFRNEARMHAHAIVGADAAGVAASCESEDGVADPGRRYVEVAERTHGTVHSICGGDFGNDLRDIGNQAFGLQVQFFLSRPATPGTVTVELDGRPTVDGWGFDEESNSVIFEEGSAPAPGARLRISYEAQCFARQQ